MKLCSHAARAITCEGLSTVHSTVPDEGLLRCKLNILRVYTVLLLGSSHKDQSLGQGTELCSSEGWGMLTTR